MKGDVVIRYGKSTPFFASVVSPGKGPQDYQEGFDFFMTRVPPWI